MVMNICRSNVKKHFKKQNKNQMLEAYDSIKAHLQHNIADLNEENINVQCRLLFDLKELHLVHAFISWYVVRTRRLLEKVNRKNNQVDDHQLKALIGIRQKIEVLLDG